MWTTSLGEACLPLRETLSPARQDGSWIERKNALRLLLSTPPHSSFSQAQTSRYLSHLRLLLFMDVQSMRDLYPC